MEYIFVYFLIFKPFGTAVDLKSYLYTSVIIYSHTQVRNSPSFSCLIISPQTSCKPLAPQHSCFLTLSFPSRKKPQFCGSLSTGHVELGLIFTAGASNTGVCDVFSETSSTLCVVVLMGQQQSS